MGCSSAAFAFSVSMLLFGRKNTWQPSSCASLPWRSNPTGPGGLPLLRGRTVGLSSFLVFGSYRFGGRSIEIPALSYLLAAGSTLLRWFLCPKSGAKEPFRRNTVNKRISEPFHSADGRRTETEAIQTSVQKSENWKWSATP